jgi:RNA-directed DNA polymerase
MQRIREKVRATIGIDPRPSLADKVAYLTPVLRGWGNYFRHLNSSQHFAKVDRYVNEKLWRWARRKHGGRAQRLRSQHLRELGLHTLSGTIRYAR